MVMVIITVVEEILAVAAASAVAVVLLSPVLLMDPNIISDIKDPSVVSVMFVTLVLLLEDCY